MAIHNSVPEKKPIFKEKKRVLIFSRLNLNSLSQKTMKILAETERLILREIDESDETGMHELDSDPDVHKYLGNKPFTAIEQTRENIRFIKQQYLDNGIARWAAIEKSSGDFIGWSGLKLITTEINNHTMFYDVGYRLIKKHWGKGYATESAIAALKYGFNILKLNEIYGMADADNAGSNHVLKKIGLTFVETFYHNGVLHNWYKIEKGQYI
jgi:[ribosomal protein S5]-alanine N-acetyltransferase